MSIMFHLFDQYISFVKQTYVLKFRASILDAENKVSFLLLYYFCMTTTYLFFNITLH